MLHLFFDGKPWFLPKRHGYGAGLPVAWQGWVLLLSYTAAIMGLGVLAPTVRGLELAAVILVMVVLTVAFVMVAKARTEGGWRWRHGKDD